MVDMQVKLWPKNESGLKELIKDTKAPEGLLSVAKMANWAIALYITNQKQKKAK